MCIPLVVVIAMTTENVAYVCRAVARLQQQACHWQGFGRSLPDETSTTCCACSVATFPLYGGCQTSRALVASLN